MKSCDTIVWNILLSSHIDILTVTSQNIIKFNFGDHKRVIMMKKNDHFTLHEFGYCFKLLESKPWYMSLLQKYLCTPNETA